VFQKTLLAIKTHGRDARATIPFSRQICEYTSASGFYAAVTPPRRPAKTKRVVFITFEVIELLHFNDNLPVSSDHDGVEETRLKK
jgi:hypothetical protein